MDRAAFLRQTLHPLTRIRGGVPAPHPGFLAPCLPTARKDAPSGSDWIHELEYRGARTQAHLINGKPALFDVDGAECSATYTSITQALQLLAARDAILDGNIVVLDERGAADPSALRQDIDNSRTDRLVYFVFDLLYLDGIDLRSVPLIERKRLLAHLLNALPMRRVQLATHVEADGPSVLARACEMQLTGIVSKKRESAYRAGTQDTWVSVGCGAKRMKRVRGEPLALTSQRFVAPSKEQLAVYWTRVAHRALKYLARRPLELVRDPPGPLPVLTEAVHLIRPKGFMGDTQWPVWIEDLEGLLGLVYVGAIELHPWNCTIDDMDHPDTMVFDVEAFDWNTVTRAALALRSVLAADKLKSWPKLTGANSIQVIVPFESRVTYDLAQRYSVAIAQRVLDKYSAEGRQLFIHTEANFRGRTAIGTYSPRARTGFPIAAPVSWKRIADGIRADAFALTHPFHAS